MSTQKAAHVAASLFHAYYLANGSRPVYPARCEIEVYRVGASPQTLSENDTLTGERVLPGFSVVVADVFKIE